MLRPMDEQPPAMTLNPFPDQRDIYLLAVGLIVGVLLGPLLLGQVAPRLYEAWFVGGAEIRAEIEQRQHEHDEAMQLLQATGVTDVAVSEAQAQFDRELAPRRAQLQQAVDDHRRWLAGRLNALVIAVLALMVLEAVVSPRPQGGGKAIINPALARLITGRYALLALWLAVVVAQPRVLLEVAWVFVLLLLAVALAAAFVPLGRGPATNEHE